MHCILVPLLVLASPLPEAPERHVEQIDGVAPHRYTVTLGGTLDERNSSRYPETYGASHRWEPRFQPNRFVVIENTGRVDVVNPWLVIDGRRDWYSAETVLQSVLEPGMSDAERAIALWSFLARHDVQAHNNNSRVGPPFPCPTSRWEGYAPGHPSQSTFQERANPIKALNTYYVGGCSLAAANYVVLARAAGLPARAVWLNTLGSYAHHCVAEVWYDGDWHLFDTDLRTFYLEEDNQTVASYEDVHRRNELARRGHDGGMASRGIPKYARMYADYFPPNEMPVDEWLSTMSMRLRPGEMFLWRWDHDGKFRAGNNHRNIRKRSPGGLVPYHLSAGHFIYRPKLVGPVYRRGIVSELNLEPVEPADDDPTDDGPSSDKNDARQPITAEHPAWVIYRVASPYPIVGGNVSVVFRRATTDDACRIAISVGDEPWRQIWSTEGDATTGELTANVPLDEALDAKPKPAIYAYHLRIELDPVAEPGNVQLRDLELKTDVQTAASSLPALMVGPNEVVYRDESPAGRKVRITHGWQESSATQPPVAPKKPEQPVDGTTVAAESLEKLTWQPAVDPDGEGIVQYHVQVSPRNDFLHPISPSFNRLTGSPESEWTVPRGFFINGKTYHWRVRAQDKWGAWSPWSDAWSFRVNDE